LFQHDILHPDLAASAKAKGRVPRPCKKAWAAKVLLQAISLVGKREIVKALQKGFGSQALHNPLH
jgi:hypothetical protein